MPYRFIEHTADIAVEVSAKTIDDLFKISCSAWQETVLDSINSFSVEEKEINIDAESLEELLVCFLNELNFYLYTEQWVFNSISSLKIVEEIKFVRLNVKIAGEPFNKNIHHLKEEIKAVTYHQLKIEKIDNFFKTIIVFDI